MKRRRRQRPKKLNRDLSLADQRKLRTRWRGWFDRITDEIADLMIRHEVFSELRNVANDNDETRDPPFLFEWMMRNYAEAVGVGIRRLCDTRKDVVSLGRVLFELLENPGVVSRTYHVGLYRKSPRDHAHGTFDRYVGAGRKVLGPRAIRSDLSRLEKASERIRKMVNKRVAHAAPRGQLRKNPTFGQIGDALRVLDKTAVRYQLLITAKYQQTCKPVLQIPWQRVLQKAWMDEF